MLNKRKLSLIISTYDDIKNPYYGGGGAIAVHEVAKRLSRIYRVRVLSWNYSGKKIETIDGVIYQRFGFKFLGPKVAMFAYQLLLPLLAVSQKYDIWLESFCPPFTTAFLPLFTRKPVIGIVHMLAAEDMERKYKLPFHLIENAGIKKYKHIIVTSPLMKEKILTVSPKSSVAVISNGIDKVYAQNSPREKTILFLGRIEVDQKGLDLLIPAFKQFNDANNNSFTLVIAGDGDIRQLEKLKQIIKDNNVGQSVVFAGRVSGEKKNKLLRSAACLVVTSRFETYSIVALESMAYGTPLVCFDIPGLSWVSPKIAKKVRPYDVNKFSQAILQIVTKPEDADAMKKQGREYAKQFTWDEIAKHYEDYLTHLI